MPDRQRRHLVGKELETFIRSSSAERKHRREVNFQQKILLPEVAIAKTDNLKNVVGFIERLL